MATVEIRARVTGYLSKIYFTDGEEVKEGQPLLLIDPRPYQAELDQAQAELGRSQAQLKRLDADLARAEKLLPKRTISQEDYDKIAADRAEADGRRQVAPGVGRAGRPEPALRRHQGPDQRSDQPARW